MLNNDTKLLYKFIFKVIFYNKHSLFIYGFLIIFYTISLLFGFYILEFKDKFITKLQSVYPYSYVYSKANIKPISPKTKIYKEIFEINFEQLTFSYKNDTDQILFKNIALRSFDINNIPTSVDKYTNDILKKKYIIYTDQILYKKLTSSKKYHGGIYISYTNSDKKLFVQIRSIEIFDTTKWIVIPNYIAKDLFGDDYFDKNVISAKEQNIWYHIYKQRYPNTYRWDDSLSFFGIVFYKLSSTFYYMFNILFSIMLILFMFITLKSLLNEFKKMTLFASRFGMDLKKLSISYIFGLILYFNSILVISYIFAKLFINYLNPIINFTNQLDISSGEFMILNTIIIIITSIFTYYYGIYFKRAKYV